MNIYADSDALKGVLKADMENIRATLEKINSNIFEDVVNDIFKAKRYLYNRT